MKFPLYTPDTAPAGSRPQLEGIQKSFGFIPNLFAAMAESPAVLEAGIAIRGFLAKSSFTPAEQEAILIAVSVENECGFCASAHSTLAAGKKLLANEDLAALRRGKPLPTAKLDVLVQFARKLTATRGQVTEDDVEHFVAAGYTRAQALEVVIGVAYKTLTNYVDHMAHVPLNEQFQVYAWTRALKSVT